MRTLLILAAAGIVLGMAHAPTIAEPTTAFEHEFEAIEAFGITFPLTAKQVVKGQQAHPFYLWARQTLGAGQAPSWNFHKYLVDRDGKLIAGYGSSVEPLSPELTKAIEAALATR
jgi:glutathione peroxidase